MDEMQEDLAQKDISPQSELLILCVTETGFAVVVVFKKRQAFSFLALVTNSDLTEKRPRLPFNIHQIKSTDVNCISSFWRTFHRLLAQRRHWMMLERAVGITYM